MKTLAFLSFLFFGFVMALPGIFNITTPQQVEAMDQVAAYNQAGGFTTAAENNTENGLFGPCKPVTMIYARGTGESGNVGGKNSPGPAWFTEMRKVMGEDNLTVQGVNYEANLFGYLKGGDPEGSQNYYDMADQAVTKCPDTKLVLGGYSQGAQLAHNAARRYTNEMTSKVAAAVMFGDPYAKHTLGYIPTRKVMTICHEGDIICKNVGTASAHLTYAKDAPEAAMFVMDMLKQN
ncbi:Cutinase [Golovinomyces cichoracearum]|uniref:Cutinase n=1 Tax=Golovinomyces cichoracearum TaxID=62708 RepID=A0A420IQ52_9PEZI|nr:Cutinase [Golovinomyces cichoracearum]